jgi:hypothetical protein
MNEPSVKPPQDVEDLVRDIIWRQDDDFNYRGGRTKAIKELRSSDNPFAQFFVALMDEDAQRAASLMSTFPVLKETAHKGDK